MTNFYLARRKDGDLILFCGEPLKEGDYWVTMYDDCPTSYHHIDLGKNMYPDIKWEDESPTHVELMFYGLETDIQDLGDMHVYNNTYSTLYSSKFHGDPGVAIMTGNSETIKRSFFAARDKNDSLYIYMGCPIKHNDRWTAESDTCNMNEDQSRSFFSSPTRLFEIDGLLLPYVKWEDKYPTKIGIEITTID